MNADVDLVDLAEFQRLVRRAQEFGIFDEFVSRFRKLRESGVQPLEAGEQALREACATNPRARLQVTIARKEGQS